MGTPTTTTYEVWDWLKRISIGGLVTVNIVHSGLPYLKKNNISASLCYMQRKGFLTKETTKGTGGGHQWRVVEDLDDSKIKFMQFRTKDCRRTFNGKETKKEVIETLSLNDRLTIISDSLLCLAEIVEEMKEET